MRKTYSLWATIPVPTAANSNASGVNPVTSRSALIMMAALTRALIMLSAPTRAREAAPIPVSSDADRPARAGWAALRLLADVASSF